MESYENLGTIGEGTYGLVLKARHKATGQLVAIKKFKESDEDEQVRKTALREIRILKQLRHDNIVSLLDVFRRNGKLYLVFEYVQRTILEDLESNPAGLESRNVKRYFYQLIQSLEFIHSHNIIHRDIKPENLLVSRNGVLKLCDFGFARTLARPGAKYTDYVATRWYRAPELLVGDTNYGKAVDVWAAGCMFAEILNGSPLFPGESDIDQLFNIMRVLGDLPPRQVEIFQKNPLYVGVKLPVVNRVEPLSQRLHSLGETALDVLTGCLKYEPDERHTCAELLETKYFYGFGETFLDELRVALQSDLDYSEKEKMQARKRTRSRKNKQREKKKGGTQEVHVVIKEKEREPSVVFEAPPSARDFVVEDIRHSNHNYHKEQKGQMDAPHSHSHSQTAELITSHIESPDCSDEENKKKHKRKNKRKEPAIPVAERKGSLPNLRAGMALTAQPGRLTAFPTISSDSLLDVSMDESMEVNQAEISVDPTIGMGQSFGAGSTGGRTHSKQAETNHPFYPAITKHNIHTETKSHQAHSNNEWIPSSFPRVEVSKTKKRSHNWPSNNSKTVALVGLPLPQFASTSTSGPAKLSPFLSPSHSSLGSRYSNTPTLLRDPYVGTPSLVPHTSHGRQLQTPLRNSGYDFTIKPKTRHKYAYFKHSFEF